jgi:hypothetical protein
LGRYGHWGRCARGYASALRPAHHVPAADSPAGLPPQRRHRAPDGSAGPLSFPPAHVPDQAGVSFVGARNVPQDEQERLPGEGRGWRVSPLWPEGRLPLLHLQPSRLADGQGAGRRAGRLTGNLTGARTVMRRQGATFEAREDRCCNADWLYLSGIVCGPAWTRTRDLFLIREARLPSSLQNPQ